jgi:hypothetical protein
MPSARPWPSGAFPLELAIEIALGLSEFPRKTLQSLILIKRCARRFFSLHASNAS